MTFPAHQVPALALKARFPQRWDGLALVVGSVMPDLWYTTTGWVGYVGGGQPKWVDGHPWSLQVQYSILPGVVLTILLRRVVMPVVPAVLPRLGVLRLRDYRLLALAHHRWWVTVYSVAVGAFSHLALDAVFGWRPVTALADVIGFLIAGRMLHTIASDKLLWSWHGYRTRPPDPEVRRGGVALVRCVLVVGTVVSFAYGWHRHDDGTVVAIMGATCVMIATTVVAGLVGRPFVRPLPAPVDPLVE